MFYKKNIDQVRSVAISLIKNLYSGLFALERNQVIDDWQGFYGQCCKISVGVFVFGIDFALFLLGFTHYISTKNETGR